MNASSYIFHVTETSKNFIIQWQIPNVRTVTDYLYWALKYNVRYDLRLRPTLKDVDVELCAVSGQVSGERKDGLYWSYILGLHRRDLRTTHHFTQHGLDAMPSGFFESLRLRNTPLFLVEMRKGGAFSMTLYDWDMYFVSGRNGQALDSMATGK